MNHLELITSVEMLLEENNIQYELRKEGESTVFADLKHQDGTLSYGIAELEIITVTEKKVELEFCDMHYHHRVYPMKDFDKVKRIVSNLVTIMNKNKEISTMIHGMDEEKVGKRLHKDVFDI